MDLQVQKNAGGVMVAVRASHRVVDASVQVKRHDLGRRHVIRARSPPAERCRSGP